jgi:hypothetical protein
LWWLLIDRLAGGPVGTLDVVAAVGALDVCKRTWRYGDKYLVHQKLAANSSSIFLSTSIARIATREPTLYSWENLEFTIPENLEFTMQHNLEFPVP